MRNLIWVVPLVLAAGCNRGTYIELLAGEWAGLATAGAVSLPTTATFEWDKKAKENQFTGRVDFDGYYYLVNGASSDKESAELTLYAEETLWGPGKMTAVMLNEAGDTMDAKFTINICPNGEGDPALCEVAGTVNLKML